MTAVAFITNQPLAPGSTGPISELASVRREVVMPAMVLRSVGVETTVISLPIYTKQHVSELLPGASHVVFGKIFINPKGDAGRPFSSDAGAYRGILDQLSATQRVSFCISDDHFEHPAFAGFYLRAAGRSPGWFASSELMRDRLQALVRQPVLVYPEPVETLPTPPRVPRRRLLDRIGAALARRINVGLEPWRIRLLWFGHPTNIESLLRALPELERLSEDFPLYLQCVTRPDSEIVARITPRGAQFSAPLAIGFTPWSLEATQQALEACDAVLLPQLVEDQAKRAKSNNRMIDSINAGRFVIAHPLPAYEDLRDYAWVGDSISEGLRWLLRHPDEALRRLERGQAYVLKHHSLEALGRFWQGALELNR